MAGYLLWGLALALPGVALVGFAIFANYRVAGSYDTWPILLGLLGGLLAIIPAVGGAVMAVDVTACEHQADRMGLEWDSAWTPCLVELPDGRWVDIDDIENNLTGEVVLKDDDR